MYFTNEEKKAIVSVASGMLLADGSVDAKEVAFNAIVFKALGISQDELKYGLETPLSDALQVIKKMLPHEKRFVAAYLGSVIIADGDISDRETTLWRAISTICELPTMSLAESPSIMKEFF